METLLNELSFDAQVRYHSNIEIFSVVKGDITVYFPSGKRAIPINKKIDNVVSVEIVRMLDSQVYYVFVFGEKIVSITGIMATENKHFGEKLFDSGISLV